MFMLKLWYMPSAYEEDHIKISFERNFRWCIGTLYMHSSQAVDK